MANISGNLTVSTTFAQVNSNGIGGGTVRSGGNQNYTTAFVTSLTAGSANAVDLKYTAVLTLNSAASTLDLASLTDDTGAAISFARVRSVTIRNRATVDAQKLTIGGGTASPWLGPGGANWSHYVFASTSGSPGVYAFSAPNTAGAVVASSAKTLKIDPGSYAITADVEIVGCSA